MSSLKVIFRGISQNERLWHYEKANVDHIRRSIDEFSWERCFANTSVNNKFHMFNKIIKSIITFLTKQLFAMTEQLDK